MSEMRGVRRPDGTDVTDLERGEYALDAGRLWFCLPDGQLGQVTAPPWDSIVVEEDGSVTVEPSIWDNKLGNPPGWHGHLRKGLWMW